MRGTLRIVAIAMLLAGLAGLTEARAEPLVWIEGEQAARNSFAGGGWFAPKGDEKDALSGGDWLCHDAPMPRDGTKPAATWKVQVPRAGEYHFWVRKFWKHGPFQWRFGQGTWRQCGRDISLAESQPLRTHVTASWVYLGKVDLEAGPQTLEVQLTTPPGKKSPACFDCFVLSEGVFVPRGKLKPGQRIGQADEGHFAWEPAIDPFDDKALLDLRSLNESRAGASGWVRRKGDGFVLGGGKAVRFWAVNVSANNAGQDHASIDYLARKLAKLGVNMVRYHSPLFARSGDPAKVDADKLDDLHYLVAAMKREGIYTHLSFYFPLWFEIGKEAGIEGYPRKGNNKAFGLLFFNERMQQIHRSWLKQVLTTVNPYTKVRLANDPALAIIETTNEDSLLFWTFTPENMADVQWARLEKLYGAWLARRYGSADKALVAWGARPDKKDDPASGRMRLFQAWHMTAGGLQRSGGAQRKRMRDQVRFLASLQKQFYADTKRYLKDELGYGGLTVASNWQTADPAVLGPAERWSYTACDVIDRHGYFGGKHTGPGASYSVRTGHAYENRPAVTHPERLPIQFDQVAGYPQVISEINWPNPNRFRTDMTTLGAVYASVQGADGLYFFAVGSNYLSDRSIGKFQLGSPEVIATFPAAALVYRRGDVPTASPALTRRMTETDVFSLDGGGIRAAAALDELRKADVPGQRAGDEGNRFDPRLFYKGPVRYEFLGQAGRGGTRRGAFKTEREGVIATDVGGAGMRWDPKAGVMRFWTDRSAGATGMLADADVLRAGPVTIRSGNEYGAVLVVALDDKLLADSRTVLIQAMTEDQPLGWKAPGGKIASLGSYPFGVRKIDATVQLPVPAGAEGEPTVTVLDENGYAADLKAGKVEADGKTVTVRLNSAGVYHLVRW